MDFRDGIFTKTLLLVFVLVEVLYTQIDAKRFTVGGIQGWTDVDSATSNARNSRAWIPSRTVTVDDVIVFSHVPEYHDVYLLPTKEDFDSCNFTAGTLLSPGLSPASKATYSWTTPAAGVFYFACSLHCPFGEKLTLRVDAAPFFVRSAETSNTEVRYVSATPTTATTLPSTPSIFSTIGRRSKPLLEPVLLTASRARTATRLSRRILCQGNTYEHCPRHTGPGNDGAPDGP